MSCNGLKIQTEVPKMPFGGLICPGGALKVDITICLLVCMDYGNSDGWNITGGTKI